MEIPLHILNNQFCLNSIKIKQGSCYLISREKDALIIWPKLIYSSTFQIGQVLKNRWSQRNQEPQPYFVKAISNKTIAYLKRDAVFESTIVILSLGWLLDGIMMINTLYTWLVISWKESASILYFLWDCPHH